MGKGSEEKENLGTAAEVEAMGVDAEEDRSSTTTLSNR